MEREKKAKSNEVTFLDKNPGIVTGMKGMALGAGTMATIALVKEVLDSLKERKRMEKLRNPGVASDTIVLTLPGKSDNSKLASARDSFVDLQDEEDEENTTKWRQARNADGTFASGWELSSNINKTAQAYNPTYLEGAQDKSLGFALGIGGAGLGFYLAHKVYDYLRNRRIKREIAAAQKEYADFLSKTAETVPVEQNKPTLLGRAGDAAVDAASWTADTKNLEKGTQNFLGVAGGVALLVAAASTYLTKKFLDKKFSEGNNKRLVKKPIVNNVVFKTAGADPVVMNPVDALGFVKFASMVMSGKYPIVHGTEKTAAGKSWLGQALDKIPSRDQLRAANELWDEEQFKNHTIRPAQALRMQFRAMGTPVGSDPSTWHMNYVEPRGYMPGRSEAAANLWEDISYRPEQYAKAWMGDEFNAQREYFANNFLQNWYGRNLKGTFIGNMFGQPIQWLLRALGRAFTSTDWGKKMMFQKMKNTLQQQASEKDKYYKRNAKDIAAQQAAIEDAKKRAAGGQAPAAEPSQPAAVPVTPGPAPAAAEPAPAPAGAEPVDPDKAALPAGAAVADVK